LRLTAFTPLGGLTKREGVGATAVASVSEMPSRHLQMDAADNPYCKTRYEDVTKTMGQFLKSLGFQAAKVRCPMGFRCSP